MNITFPKIGLSTKNNVDNDSETSHVTIKDLFREAQKYNLNIKNIKNFQKSNPSSKLSTTLFNKSQEIIDKFMRKQKSKHKEKQQSDVVTPIRIIA